MHWQQDRQCYAPDSPAAYSQLNSQLLAHLYGPRAVSKEDYWTTSLKLHTSNQWKHPDLSSHWNSEICCENTRHQIQAKKGCIMPSIFPGSSQTILDTHVDDLRSRKGTEVQMFFCKICTIVKRMTHLQGNVSYNIRCRNSLKMIPWQIQSRKN